MKIVLCSDSFADRHPSGTQTFLRELTRQWLSRGDVSLTIVVTASEEEARLREALPIGDWRAVRIPLRKWPARLWWLRGGANVTGRIGRHDVYLSGWHWPLGAADAPFVGIVHDLTPLDQRGAGRVGPKARLYRRLYRASLETCRRRAAGIVCISHATRAKLEEELSGPFPPTTVIHHSVEVSRWANPVDTGTARRVLAKHGLEKGGRFILAVGRHIPNKNFVSLVEGFRCHVAPVLPDCRLVLAGGFGPETPRIEAAIAGHRLSDRVRLLGFTSAEDLAVLMREASLIAAPSFSEGFGLPVIEAFAAGTPVACSDSPALVEISGGAALVFDPCNLDSIGRRLLEGLTDAVRRDAMRAAGTEVAARMTWGACAESYLRFFAEVCGGPSARCLRGETGPTMSPKAAGWDGRRGSVAR